MFKLVMFTIIIVTNARKIIQIYIFLNTTDFVTETGKLFYKHKLVELRLFLFHILFLLFTNAETK